MAPDTEMARTELLKVIDDQIRENEAIQKQIARTKKENKALKNKSDNLQDRLGTLVNLLQDNSRIFQEIFINATCALQTGNFLDPGRKMPNLLSNANVFEELFVEAQGALVKEKPPALISPLSINVPLHRSCEVTHARLSTISEERSSMLSNFNSVTVILTRLPQSVVDVHVKKQDTSVNHESHSMIPCYSSTPKPDNGENLTPPLSLTPEKRSRRKRPQLLKEPSLKSKLRRVN